MRLQRAHPQGQGFLLQKQAGLLVPQPGQPSALLLLPGPPSALLPQTPSEMHNHPALPSPLAAGLPSLHPVTPAPVAALSTHPTTEAVHVQHRGLGCTEAGQPVHPTHAPPPPSLQLPAPHPPPPQAPALPHPLPKPHAPSPTRPQAHTPPPPKGLFRHDPHFPPPLLPLPQLIPPIPPPPSPPRCVPTPVGQQQHPGA